MSHDLLTIKEIARRLDQPESNIRYYRDKFEKYLASEGTGRKKRFKPESIKVFETVVQGLSKNMSSQEIEAELAGKFSQNPSLYQGQEQKLAARPGLYTEHESSHFQHILANQAGALAKLADALNLDRGLRQDLHQVRTGCARMKKALKIIWHKQNKLSQGNENSCIDKRIAVLEQELKNMALKQEEIEQKLDRELSELRGELKKCQFWSKRMLMQTSSSKISQDKPEG